MVKNEFVASKEVLRRYAAFFDAINKQYPIMTASDLVRNAGVDWSVNLAMQPTYFERKINQIGSAVLCSALLISITISPVLSPAEDFGTCPDADSSRNASCANDILFRAHYVVLTVSSFMFIMSILASLSFVRAITRPYSEVDTLVLYARVGAALENLVYTPMWIGTAGLVTSISTAHFLNFGTAVDSVLVTILSVTTVLIVTLVTVKVENAATAMQWNRTEWFVRTYCDARGFLATDLNIQ